ncbi:MAG: hypothetical protein ACK559_05465, partial [bacterium]
ADLLALVVRGTDGLDRDRVADLLPEERVGHAFDKQSEQLALALVLLRRDDREGLVGLEEDAVGAVDADLGAADHAVEVLEGALDAVRGAEAVALPKDLVVEVLVGDLDHRLLDRDPLER